MMWPYYWTPLLVFTAMAIISTFQYVTKGGKKGRKVSPKLNSSSSPRNSPIKGAGESEPLPPFFSSPHCKEFMVEAAGLFDDYFQGFRKNPTKWWEHRNVVGATIFHGLILYEKFAMAKVLIEALQKENEITAARYLLSSFYQNGLIKEYDGENALHMVIAKRNLQKSDHLMEIIEWLCTQCPALVQGRATGEFFQKNSYDDERSDDVCAWGEYPLSFAACLNDTVVVDFLVKKAGADMMAQDTLGNTVLHSAVNVGAPLSMIQQLRRLWYEKMLNLYTPQEGWEVEPLHSSPLFPTLRWGKAHDAMYTGRTMGDETTTTTTLLTRNRWQPFSIPHGSLALDQIVNSQGFTPLMLAAKMDTEDAKNAFKAMMEDTGTGRGLAWSYAHVSSFTYPLEGYDDIWDIYMASDGEDHPLTPHTTLRQYPIFSDAGEGEYREGDPTLAKPHPLSLPKLWPRHTLLELLAQEDVNGESGVCSLEQVKRMLEMKWLLYAEVVVTRGFLYTLAFLACLTGAIVLRSHPLLPSHDSTLALPFPFSVLQAMGFGRAGVCSAQASALQHTAARDGGSDGSGGGDASQCYTLCVLEALILGACVVEGGYTARGWWAEGLSYLTGAHGSTILARFFSTSTTLLFMAMAYMVQVGQEGGETFHFLLALCGVLCYLKLVRFTMALATVGQFIIMLKVMFFNDVLRFMGIATILIAAFANAFFVLGRYEGWGDAGVVLFRSMIAFVGEGEGMESRGEEGPREGMWIFSVVFLIVGSVMLLNVLIAMLGQTYDSISAHAEVLATIERARLIREVELGMSEWERLNPTKGWVSRAWGVVRGWVVGGPSEPPKVYWSVGRGPHAVDFQFPPTGPVMVQVQGEWREYMAKNNGVSGGGGAEGLVEEASAVILKATAASAASATAAAASAAAAAATTATVTAAALEAATAAAEACKQAERSATAAATAAAAVQGNGGGCLLPISI